MDEIYLWRMRARVVIRSETPPHPDPLPHEDVVERGIFLLASNRL
jgi:hypothetical protein